jgi:hypothetical protein
MKSIVQLKSARILEVQYDAETQEMWITFVRGGKYKYSNVTEDIYIALVTAESPGRIFDQEIKSNPSKYPFEKAI